MPVLSVVTSPIMLSVIMLDVVVLSVMAPIPMSQLKNVQYQEITVRKTVLKLQREVITIPDRENYHASGIVFISK